MKEKGEVIGTNPKTDSIFNVDWPIINNVMW